MGRAGRHYAEPRWLMNEPYGACSMPISVGVRPDQLSLVLPFYWMYQIVRARYRVLSIVLSPYMDNKTSHKFNIPTLFY
jgi:hypothetical protein